MIIGRTSHATLAAVEHRADVEAYAGEFWFDDAEELWSVLDPSDGQMARAGAGARTGARRHRRRRPRARARALARRSRRRRGPTSTPWDDDGDDGTDPWDDDDEGLPFEPGGSSTNRIGGCSTSGTPGGGAVTMLGLLLLGALRRRRS